MNQTKRPIIETLQSFQAAKPISFHVPGHKNGLLSKLPEELKKALKFDVTELTGLDDLHAPEEMIAEAQHLLADAYGAERSFFLVNGSTAGNLAMIRAVCSPGDMLLVQRNAHKSVFHALELAGAQAVLLTPEWDEHTCTAGAVSAATVKESLERHPEAKGVFVTYPTYYGTTGNELADIVTFAHANGIPVLCDEAHGAHFVVGDPFPPSALSFGVDVTVQSAHKTLSAMTQASFLHVNSQLVEESRVAKWLSMLQTSSPSYLLLASLDDARAMAATYKETDKRWFLTWRAEFVEKMRQIPSMEVIETDDPLKILLRQKEVSGYKLQRALEQTGIYSELADELQVLFVLPLLTEGVLYPTEQISETITSAIHALQQGSSQAVEEDLTTETPRSLVITTSGASKNDTEWVPAKLAIDRNAANAIIPYPPGIPLILNGERLDDKQVRKVCQMVQEGAKFQGAVRAKEQEIEFEVWSV